jgi:Protein ENHANCED DISEASE RESISTANCE 2, C-terminal
MDSDGVSTGGNNDLEVDEASESLAGGEGYERAEESESGIVTEMEHFRSQSMNMNHIDLPGVTKASSQDDNGVMTKKKSRLSTRVAKGIKKQLTSSGAKSSSDKKPAERHRSLSPPRSRSHRANSPTNSSGDEGDGQTRLSATAEGEGKKKHKSKYKHVAKAAAAAARKLKGKKSSTKIKERGTTDVAFSYSSSDNSSRTSTPTPQQMLSHSHSGAAVTTATMLGGISPIDNSSFSAKTILDGGVIPEHVMQAFPDTLEECDEESSSYNNDETVDETVNEAEASMEMTVEDFAAPPTDAATATGAVVAAVVATGITQPTLAATAQQKTPALTEDEALKLAEAMALAVHTNPTKSHQDIQRMVLSQPEFQHLALPEALMPPSSNNSGNSSSMGSKKTWKNLQSKLASGAKTAQKGLMEYAGSLDLALGSSTTSFPFSITSAKPPPPPNSSSVVAPSSASVPGRESSLSSASSTSAARDSVTVRPSVAALTTVASMISTTTTTSSAAAATTAVPTTITEESKLGSLEQSHSTGASMQGSNTSFPPLDDDAQEGVLPSRKSELPITMTDVIWKRRSGFGVYYRSSAWERRRFVLQGNALSYFRAKGEHSDDKGCGGEGGADLMDDRTERFEHDPQYTTHEKSVGGTSKSTSTKQRMMDALEQTATSLGLSASVVPGLEKPSGDGSSSARGYMDLVKENATVCATLGHSGAPSPFCLSIKVNGETKWKLCFASHQGQLRWMAAISDVIVQHSVDAYNLKLLSAADPSNLDPTSVFLSSVYEPPSNAEGQLPSNLIPSTQASQAQLEDSDLPTPNYQHLSGRRLWMMEPYVIRARAELPLDEVKEDEGICDDDDTDDEDEEPESTNQQPETDATANDSDVWFMPEKRLMLAAVLMNVALLYARNSSLTVQTFWTMVIGANMTLFACLESMPRPGVAMATAGSSVQSARPKVRPSKKRDNRKGTGSGGSGANKSDGAIGGKSAKKKEKYIPMAGMSAVRLKDHTDPKVNAKGEPFAAWMQIPGESLAVRSHGYLKTNLKVPSPGSLYELVQMDIFESPSRYPDMAPRVKLPKLAYQPDPDETKTWRAPDHFIVSLSLPTDPPKLGGSSSDGGGYTVTMYFTMNKATRDILKRVTAEGYNPVDEPPSADVQKSQVNAVRLFEDWCRRAPNDLEFQKRFKMVPNCPNAKEVGLPSWIAKYNGKPFLIKRPGQTGFFLPHPELSCIEFDISLHVFPYLAKQGICYMKDTLFKKILASVGFVIEGRSDDELPECVIGLGQVCYPDPEMNIQAADFFAGTAPRSFEAEDTTAPKTSLASDVSAPAKATGGDTPNLPVEITV